MDYSSRQDRSRSSRSTRRSSSSGSRQQRRTTSSTAGGRPLRGRTDTGYRLGSRGMSFTDRRGGVAAQLNPRSLMLIAAALIVLILLAVLLSTCTRSCSNKEAEETQTVEAVNELDARVAAGASSELTSRLSVVLDRNDRFAEIAKNADQYDERVIQLAIDEPETIDFVAQLPTHDKTSEPYEDSVTKGTVPKLFNWDSRWGYVDYAGLPLAVTGSGPTVLSMGYMGLTGRSDKTPADIAALSEADGTNTGEEYTTAELFTREAETLGLRVDTFEPSAEEITASLYNNHPTICQIKANTLTPYAHWVLAASVNEDGTINVYDPTSTEVSSHPWSATTISGYSSSIHVLQLSDKALAEQEGEGEGESEGEGEYSGEG